MRHAVAAVVDVFRREPPELLALAIGTVALSAVFMFANLGDEPFWVDESIAVLPANAILSEGVPRSPFDLNYMAPQLEDGLWDPSAPLYRYSVAAVAAVFGFSELTARAWSVLLGLVMLGLCFVLFRRVFGGATALLAVAILASITDFQEFSREARHFTFVGSAMLACFYHLGRVGEHDRSRAWWPVFALATVLGHAVGYISMPVAAVIFAANWKARPLSKRYLWVYAAVVIVYVAIQAKFVNTLPFLHSIGCHNRVAGCHPGPFFYLGSIVAFLSGSHSEMPPPTGPSIIHLPTAFPVLMLLVGLVALAVMTARDRKRWRDYTFVWAWLLIPLVALSTRDLKFPRYLFYILPVLALVLAVGVHSLGRGRYARIIVFVLGLLLVLLPQIRAEDGELTLRSRFLSHGWENIVQDKTDNWELLRAKVSYLEERMKPGDVVVTSFDDAGLGYYLGHFVYGFLNSEHDDTFFYELILRARRDQTRVFFIDTLPEHNYCHTPGLEPQNIDCRHKYFNFYQACLPDSARYIPACVRKKFP